MIINAKNERTKKCYFEFLREAKRHSESTIKNASKAIQRFEEFTGGKDFNLNKTLAVDFKKHLSQTKGKRSGECLSLSTLNSTINNLKEFFKWLSYRDGYKRKINLHDVEYLSLSENETRAAKATGYRPYPTLEQIKKVVASMPLHNEIDRRNQALIAFTALTGMRDGAIVSLKLKHVDLTHRIVKQDPREVNTKNRKRIDTFFFPVGNEIERIVVDWVNYLVKDKLYGINAPLFPRTRLSVDDNNSFAGNDLEPTHWTSASQMTKIFKEAFANAGFDYYNPHSFRNTLVNFGERLCQTPEEFKAWSQNLGHESPLTTFTSYGYVDVHRQGDIILNIAQKADNDDKSGIMAILKDISSKIAG